MRSATLLDSCSTAVMLTLGQQPGMSLQLSVNYTTAVPAGTTVLIDASVVRVSSLRARSDGAP